MVYIYLNGVKLRPMAFMQPYDPPSEDTPVGVSDEGIILPLSPEQASDIHAALTEDNQTPTP